MEADSENSTQDDNLSLEAKIFVVDTSVFIYDSLALYKFENNDIKIHIKSIVELNRNKEGIDTKNFHSRDFSRNVEKLKNPAAMFNGGVKLADKLGLFSMAVNTPIHDDVKNIHSHIDIDAEIINLAYVTKLNNPKRQVILVSRDTNMRLLARSLGIEAEDYLNDKVENTDFLFSHTETIKFDEENLAELYKKGVIDYHIKNSIPNQNYFIDNDNSDDILIKSYNKNQIKLLKFSNAKAFNISAKNNEQVFLMDALLDKNISLVTVQGVAGTGKTLLTLACAFEQLSRGDYNTIHFTRKTIPSGPDLGFLPGDIEAKLSPYMKGMKDNIDKLSQDKQCKSKIINFTREDRFQIEALTFIRGRSIEKSIIIIDEGQNVTVKDIKLIATRAGEGSKIIVMGDITQIDDPKLSQFSNGFTYIADRFMGQDCHSHIRLIKSERSSFAALAGELL